MKPFPLFTAGIAALLSGALLRNCEPGVSGNLVVEWCGPTPQAMMMNAAHAHCAGCGVMEFGALLIALSLASAVMRTVGRRRGMVGR
jgi:hypothetical protein